MGREDHDRLVIPRLKRVALARDATLREQRGSGEEYGADCKARCSEEIGECAQVILGDGVLLEVLPQCLGAEPSFQKRVESWGAPNVRPKFAPKLVGHTG